MSNSTALEAISAAAMRVAQLVTSTPSFLRQAAAQGYPPTYKYLASNDEEVAVAFVVLVMVAFILHAVGKGTGLR
jgi:hypothetical protein